MAPSIAIRTSTSARIRTLTFNTTVTASGIVEAPDNNDGHWASGSSVTNFNNSWNTTFNNVTGTTNKFINKLATIQISLPMTNTHTLIEVPSTNDAATITGQQRLYNKAQVILTVSNLNSGDPYTSNVVVTLRIQSPPTSADVPGADPTPTVINYTNPILPNASLPFLTLNNKFYDRREGKTNITTQIDVGLYKKLDHQRFRRGERQISREWCKRVSHHSFRGRQSQHGHRGRNAGGNKLGVVRLTNGISPPSNGGAGWTIATPDPLYVWGNYNQTVSGNLGTTNTATGTVPCALMSDALTILSSAWSDSTSLSSSYSTGSGSWDANAATVNAAILTGIVPSTGTDSMHFSGGVHNLPRLLEDWTGVNLTLNTSIINLYNSSTAVGGFRNPGTYYAPPTRKFSYDNNFSDPTKVPPGIPCALVALRYSWATPPPGTVSYNVSP